MDFSLEYIISQILVLTYYILYSSTFHLKDNKNILTISSIATLINSFSYYLLNAYTGVAMCLIGIIRNIIFKENKKSKFKLLFILTLIVSISIFTFDNWFSLLNIFATVLYTYSLWQKSTKIYKLLGIIINILMIVYNIFIESIFGVILLTISFISSLIGFIKNQKNDLLVS